MSSWKLVNVFFVEHSIWPLVFLKLLLKLLLLFLLLVRDFKKNRDDDVNDFDVPLVVIVVLY